MDKFDKFFKGASKNMYTRIVNTYVDYLTDYGHHYLYTNGYSVVLSNECRTDFKENLNLKESIVTLFEGFIDTTDIKDIITYDYDYLKKNGFKDGKNLVFRVNNDYSINITLLNKIKGMIGCSKVNFIVKNNSPIIEVIGRDIQVGYLLPMKVY